jgi:serine/threonine protein kinase
MPILTGKRLGPYEILSAIGAGGMGEVYRAKDTRLNRIVAIKVLPAHLAGSSELRERFEREARTIASLNHPHICTLYDVGHQDGTDYLVMEYLEGETLAQRLVKGPLPLDQVLQYAIEIADALDKAHRKGITHRDLKPGNIMLTKSGTKLLDFGLAKLKQEVAPANVHLSQLPTANEPLTAQGTIVGTLQYMAPEQLEGKEVDARTDIFAFGAVVYEMTTGKRAFEGKSQASVMAKILEVDPPAMSSLQPMTPRALDRLVKRCLAKDPENRWQMARDLELELKSIVECGPETATQPSSAERRRSLRGVLVSVVACLIASGFTGVAVWHLKPSEQPAEVARTLVNSAPADRFSPPRPTRTAVVLSPNGKHLAHYSAGVPDDYDLSRIWLTRCRAVRFDLGLACHRNAAQARSLLERLPGAPRYLLAYDFSLLGCENQQPKVNGLQILAIPIASHNSYLGVGLDVQQHVAKFVGNRMAQDLRCSDRINSMSEIVSRSFAACQFLGKGLYSVVEDIDLVPVGSRAGSKSHHFVRKVEDRGHGGGQNVELDVGESKRTVVKRTALIIF